MSITEKVLVVAGDLLSSTKDHPGAKAAGGELAKSALTIAKFINVALLPIAAVNFGYEKARAYFDTKFAADFAAKIKDVPSEHIVDPKVSVAGPALQGLAFTHEEKDLKEMYLSLLATAVDARVADSAHPAFAEIIRQLTAYEANLLRLVLQVSQLPIIQIRLQPKSRSGWIDLQSHILGGVDGVSEKPVEMEDECAMVDNWIRLGLVSVGYDRQLATEQAYTRFDDRPELHRLRTTHADRGEVVIQRGLFQRTGFGENFARAVGILQRSLPAGEEPKDSGAKL